MSLFDPARWERVDEIFSKALDLPESERAAWLQEACGNDPELEREVRRLVELADSEESQTMPALAPVAAMHGPLWDEWAREVSHEPEQTLFRVGDELGPYRIEGLIGRGGMGEVYVAEDPRLSRRVAVKILPSDIASDERRKRFETEARAIAALNHPNVVHVYSIEHASDVHFLTMEWVQGRTLSNLIPPNGLSESKVFEVALPLVSALATAHEKGVVHRDVKPANVMLTHDGHVKVLDFGLAKLRRDRLGAAVGDGTDSATIEGHVVGTISHMSPEQAEAKAIDHRSDIFSLGVTLYEMACGALPFRGESAASVLSSILRDTPAPPNTVNPDVSSGLSRVIMRCLKKDPADRYPSCRELAADLSTLKLASDSLELVPPHAASARRFATTFAVAAAIAAVATIAGIYFWSSRGQEAVPPRFQQLTKQPGREFFPALSPDGSFVAYASRESGNWDIYLKRLEAQRALNLTGASSADDTQPVFSPDGKRIAFRSARGGGGLFVMGASGESVERVSEFGWNPTFSPDGEKIAFATEAISRDPFDRPTNSEIWAANLTTGNARRIYAGDGVQPSWSPNGKWIAYWGLRRPGAQRDLWTIASDGAGEPKTVTSDAAVDWNPVWDADGTGLFFASDRGGSMNLWRIPMNADTGEPAGEPVSITTPSPFVSHLSVSGDSRHVAYASTVLYERLGEAGLESGGRRVAGRSVRRDADYVSSPRLSPDGAWIVYARTGLQEDIVLVEPDGSTSVDLTSDAHRDRYPRWSPDGNSVVFYSNRGGSYEAWSIDRDGTNLRALTDVPDRNLRYPVFSPDGRRLLYSFAGSSGFIVAVDPGDSSPPEEIPLYPDETQAFVPVDWSDDGQKILGYLQAASGARAGIAVFSIPEQTFERLTDFGYAPAWFSDSRSIVFQSPSDTSAALTHNYQQDSKLYFLDSETGSFHELLAIDGTSLVDPAPSPDGTRLYYVETIVESDVWLVSYETESP